MSSSTIPHRPSSPKDWNDKYDLIYDLYWVQDRTLSETKGIMEHVHGFLATDKQWRDKVEEWDLKKNVTSLEMMHINRVKQKRKSSQDKDTRFYVRGRQVPEEKINRYSKRQRQLGDCSTSQAGPTPSDIDYETPSTSHAPRTPYSPPPDTSAGPDSGAQVLTTGLTADAMLDEPPLEASLAHLTGDRHSLESRRHLQAAAREGNLKSVVTRRRRAAADRQPPQEVELLPRNIHEAEFCEPRVSIPETEQEVAFDTNEYTAHLDGMEIDADISGNLFCFDFPEEWTANGNGETHWASPNRQPAVMVAGERSRSESISSPRSQSAGRWPPISQFFDFETPVDNFTLTTKLPWFITLEKLDYTSLQIHPVLDGIMLSPTGTSASLPLEINRGVLSNLLGPISAHQLAEGVSGVTKKLQRFVPERCEGELSHTITHILEPPTSPFGLSAIFGLAAYFASNNKLDEYRMDSFLKWVINQNYTQYLQRFLQISTPTIHAFAPQILKSAVRLKNVRILTALMDRGIKFDSILDKILEIGDMDFMKQALSRVSPTFFEGSGGIQLFHLLVGKKHFHLARMLVTKGVSVDAPFCGRTPLYSAVWRKDVRAVTFLLELGASASINMGYFTYGWGYESPLARAALERESDIVAKLLEHGADTSCRVKKTDLLQWASVNSRIIYRILQEHIGATEVGFTVGDLIDAANESKGSFNAYLRRHQRTLSKQQLEQALGESIRLGYLTATSALLEYGVSPNCPSLDNPPLRTALKSTRQTRKFCQLLIQHKADVNGSEFLGDVIYKNDFRLLQLFIKAGVNLEEQGMEALVVAAELGYTPLAALLLSLGVNINTPGLPKLPLQEAADAGQLEMLEFLLDREADINAPAYPDRGYTALQAALRSETPETAWLLLERGADVTAPPALLVGGATSLEAVCHNWDDSDHLIGLCNYLLDHDAPVNRPGGKPSSALRGAIERNWDGVLARMLEPQRNAIVNYMWCDKIDPCEYWEPRTPTQLAAQRGQLEDVKLLLAYGAGVNEAPAYKFGRTALQAATSASEPDMDLVQLLLDNGAEVNAKPAVHGGITALQGAAITGDIMLAQFLIERGADVNQAPSFVEGRYAIEGAAEHGRLDMVQLFLNAGARDSGLGGFKRAIELATKNEHFAIANLLQNAPVLSFG